MYLNSICKWVTTALLVSIAFSSSAAQALAHGGGHGGGGHGGHSSGGHSAGGGFGASGAHLASGHGSARSSRFGDTPFGAGATPTHFVVDSPGFPEDLPAARIHNFLQQHLPHPHWVHWFHG